MDATHETMGKRRASEIAPLTVTRPELLDGGSDSLFRSFIHDLLAVGARIETVRVGFGSLIGLTGIQYTILISIRKLGLEGEVSVSAVAEHLHLSAAFVTIETGKLARLGLVTKEPDAADRRRVRLVVTPEGGDLLGSIAPIEARVNDVLFECLDARQFRHSCAIVSDLVACGDRALALLRYLSEASGGLKHR